MRQWRLRYREGQLVHEGIVEAATQARAELVGQAYCEQAANRRFISVGDPVLATEAILEGRTVGPDTAEWDALTAVERTAKSQGKTVDEVLEELKKKRKVSPLQAAPV